MNGRAAATAALVALALALPLGALLQPWLLPSRSALPAVPRQLNAPVLLVTAAGLRADRLGHLGGPGTTPALDRLAEQGVSFRTCWSASNQATASAAALLSGRCPARTGVHAAGDVLKPGHETLAERFAAAGYVTAAVVANPELLGAGLEQGFASFEARPLADAQAVVDAGLAQVRAAADRPWLLWLDLSELLAPYGGAALEPAAFAPEAPPGFGATRADYHLTGADLAARGWGERELAWMAARYDAALARLDAAVGRLLAELEAANRLELSTVVLTGLRGERLHERPTRVFTHGVDLHEDSLRVPLLLRLPGQASRGLLCGRLAQGLDVAPTLADLWLRKPWDGVQGRSLKPAIQSQFVVNKGLFAEGLVQPDPLAPARPATALRFSPGKGQLKLVLGLDGDVLGAYRLPEDAAEREGLALRREQVEHLRAQWQATYGDQAACLPWP